MSKPIERLVELVERDHGGCKQNTCNIAVALRLGYAVHAVELFAGSGASDGEFDRIYSRVAKTVQRLAGADAAKMRLEPHVTCPHCNAVVWLPSEVEYNGKTFCDSCAKEF